MITQFLINSFIKDKDSLEKKDVRKSYVVLGGMVGILVNFLLFIIKLSIGLISSSIAVMADAFNNLSDAFSSIVTIIGIKLADKPADSKHPFGHGRIEYISALIVSFFVMLVGLQFIKTSFNKIISPTTTQFELIPFIILLVSISFKVWLSKFNGSIGKRIDSTALKAASIDALGDVFTSSCVALSFLLSKFTTLPIDGFFGLGIALFIVYSGFSLIRETLNPILGTVPDKDLVDSIEKLILQYNNIIGMHDLVIHNYGPRKWIASLHAEVPSDLPVMKIHEIIDKAEVEISEKLDIKLVIHADPICLSDAQVNKAKEEVADIIKDIPQIKSFHDFRVVGEGEYKNLVFDIVIKPESISHKFKSDDLIELVSNKVKKLHPGYNCVITVDFEYV